MVGSSETGLSLRIEADSDINCLLNDLRQCGLEASIQRKRDLHLNCFHESSSERGAMVLLAEVAQFKPRTQKSATLGVAVGVAV